MPKINVIPTFRYADAPAAMKWLCEVIGFEEHFVVEGENGEVLHAQLRYGNGMIMLGGSHGREFDAYQQPPASPDAPVNSSAYIIVEDVQAHHDRVAASGAKIVMPLTREDHGWGYTCRDPEGNLWNFGDYDPFAESP